MTRAMGTLTMMVALAATMAVGVRADDERLKNAGIVFREMTASVDSGIAQNLLGKAQCVVIIPGVKKGAIGVGGQYGRGYIACRQNGGWSAPGGDPHRGRKRRAADRRHGHGCDHARVQ